MGDFFPGITNLERKALAALAEQYTEDGIYLCFDTVASDSGIDRKQIRRVVRSLARKGFAKFAKGLWTEDGEPAGSGYCCTKAGLDALSAVPRADSN